MSVSKQVQNDRRKTLIGNGWKAYKKDFEENEFFHLFYKKDFDGYLEYNKTARYLFEQLPEEVQTQLRQEA